MSTVTIHHPKNQFPSLLLAVVHLSKVNNVTFVGEDRTQIELTSQEGHSLRGTHTILRYLARLAGSAGLYGKPVGDLLTTSQVDQWLEYSFENNLENASEETLSAVCKTVDEHLHLRTFLADYRVTIADLAVFFGLKKNPASQKFLESNQKKFVNFSRWYEFLNAVPEIQKAVGGAAAASNSNRSGAQGSFSNLDLPNVKMGEVVTRFPPEPSGYLHIGHAKAALLNNYYAQYYQGKLIIRFDDTNPNKEKEEYVDSIIADLATLGIKSSVPITYTSDHFEALAKYAEQLIRDGLGYVDDTPMLQMREERMKGIESVRRKDSVEENLRRWKEMLAGSEEGVKCVLRGKIDMNADNKVLRDPSLFRCSVDVPHHRTGSKYKAYPLYDFACPIVDSIEGVTHALRSSEYHDRNPLYYWVVDSLKLRRPFIQDFSRLNFAYTLLSKRKLQWFVDNKLVDGWNDPRFPTIQGLLRHGLTVEALREFVLSQGASKSLNLMDIEKLWALNKKIIDPIVPRYTAIVENGRCPFLLKDGPTVPEVKSVLRHKKNAELGNKVIVYTNRVLLEREDAASVAQGEEVTLMDWGNAVVDTINKDAQGNVVSLEGHLNLAGSVKTTKKKWTWLSDTEDLTRVTLVQLDNLITKKKLEPEDKLENFVNPNSRTETAALGDPNLRSLKQGDKIQLERRGYYICDVAYLQSSKSIVLIEIPDGHTSKAQSVLTTRPQAKK